MTWVTPKYSGNQVDKAGHDLVAAVVQSAEEHDRMFEIINNWRSAHSWPLRVFQMTLRRKARLIDPDRLVAQRIKRLSAIYGKLNRERTMKLSEMHDIGGCRAILKNVKLADKLVDAYKSSGLKHHLVREYDYIRHPKKSGYRGVHLVYRYFSDRKDTYNKIKIELQIRSQSQHVWATAVEVADAFTGQALKSSLGGPDWLRFFALMSSYIAQIEGSAPVPGTPSEPDELRKEIQALDNKLNVRYSLHIWHAALELPEEVRSPGAQYYLLQLDISNATITVEAFDKKALQHAHAAYARAERDTGKSNVVLVSVDSMESLKRAYPNYFLNAHAFINLITQAIA